MGELTKAADSVASAVPTAPSRKYGLEPHWDSCDGMKGTFGWDDLSYNLLWDRGVDPASLVGSIGSTLQARGWTRVDLVGTDRWKTTLSSGSKALAMFEQYLGAPSLQFSTEPAPPRVSGC